MWSYPLWLAAQDVRGEENEAGFRWLAIVSLAKQPSSQAANQPANQASSQPANQPANQPASQPGSSCCKRVSSSVVSVRRSEVKLSSSSKEEAMMPSSPPPTNAFDCRLKAAVWSELSHLTLLESELKEILGNLHDIS
ncbi:Hemoglobin-binding protein A [Liparis tanakae]|uniref:Hemoglobin-binding protein A n=1 Tax=Liparis tanakae TaxID=230148 RepID=A0A4Z2HI07_9TELE|nr:Hemoglobin-binding protein A [Liparis tanakae]